MSDEQLRYPTGKFIHKEAYTAEEIRQNIDRISALPSKVEALIQNFGNKQLDTPYREGGWTARQVLHHLADSHMNAYIRFKWTLTENIPVIKAYNEKAWAETGETKLDPVISINLLKALHIKLVALLLELTPEQFQLEFIHPETKQHIKLARLTALYAWHGEHHLGHLEIINRK